MTARRLLRKHTDLWQRWFDAGRHGGRFTIIIVIPKVAAEFGVSVETMSDAVALLCERAFIEPTGQYPTDYRFTEAGEVSRVKPDELIDEELDD